MDMNIFFSVAARAVLVGGLAIACLLLIGAIVMSIIEWRNAVWHASQRDGVMQRDVQIGFVSLRRETAPSMRTCRGGHGQWNRSAARGFASISAALRLR